ncbi:hypothetical protein [Kordiimonas marina]|uniref:hypothetical protein n=1 Tax=Kordiimonas marina TaxID=2872312 RepID=UPI001FF48C9E|nr:hypothetical protein [Kordiimonas marina]MCJ9429412.1 hypothetical protein [Kordiimonas marina]
MLRIVILLSTAFLALIPSTKAKAHSPSIQVEARALDDHRVKFIITTDAPTPIQVMASVDLAGQKPNDTYVGYDQRVTLTGRVTTAVLDTAKASSPLPSARYNATVDFYPRWGAKGNSRAAHIPEMHAKTKLRLVGGGKSRASIVLQNKRQKWVISTVYMGYPWDLRKFEKRLGKSEKSPSTMSHLHDAYYFPGADVTLLVNRLKNEVTIWRIGKATK